MNKKSCGFNKPTLLLLPVVTRTFPSVLAPVFLTNKYESTSDEALSIDSDEASLVSILPLEEGTPIYGEPSKYIKYCEQDITVYEGVVEKWYALNLEDLEEVLYD